MVVSPPIPNSRKAWYNKSSSTRFIRDSASGVWAENSIMFTLFQKRSGAWWGQVAAVGVAIYILGHSGVAVLQFAARHGHWW